MCRAVFLVAMPQADETHQEPEVDLIGVFYAGGDRSPAAVLPAIPAYLGNEAQ